MAKTFGLDIKQMKIQAETKNLEGFLGLYLKNKEAIKSEYPEAWDEIESLHLQLFSENKVAAMR